MIFINAKRDGTVTTTPQFVPQGSSMSDIVVLSEFDYAFCTIKLTPASGIYIPDVPCTMVVNSDGKILWTASLPPEAATVPGKVNYSLIFTAADGTQQGTLEGYFTVPRGAVTNMPKTAGELEEKTIADLYAILGDVFAKFTGHDDEIASIQSRLPELAREVRLSTLTIPVSQWTDNTPTTAVTAIDGVEDENDSSFTALLLPVNNETRVASRDTSIYVENVDVRGNGKITVTMKREGEPPATDLKYVVIAFTEPNETGKAFPVSVGFVGIGGSGAGDGGETDGITEHELSKAIYDHNVSDESHEDIRLFLSSLEQRLGTLADSDDTTLDQLSEIVAYIKANKTLIDSVTTAKVNVVDIIDNLSTNVSNKPLSAAQGVKLNQSVVKLTTDYDGLKKSVDDLLAEKPQPSTIDLSRLDPDADNKGVITETLTDGTTRETKLTYDEDGNITEIEDADGHKTTLVWPSK